MSQKEYSAFLLRAWLLCFYKKQFPVSENKTKRFHQCLLKVFSVFTYFEMSTVFMFERGKTHPEIVVCLLYIPESRDFV